MTTQTKLCLLLVALLLIVIQSTYADDTGGAISAIKFGKPKPAKGGKDNSEDRTLDIIIDGSGFIMDNDENGEYQPPFPLPPVFPRNNPFFKRSTQCFSLVDMQNPLFADVCGTLPQIRYSLPNAFGHSERWQIAQVINTILGSSTATSNNPTCNRSLRLLICPLLFPPCPTQDERAAVIPCQPFCRAVKSQCVAPSLDLLPCDFLPATSQLCPVIPSPYGPYLSAYGQQSGGLGAQPTNYGPTGAYGAYIAQQAAMAQQSAMGLGQNSFGFSMSSPTTQQFVVPSVLPPAKAGYGAPFYFDQRMQAAPQVANTP